MRAASVRCTQRLDRRPSKNLLFFRRWYQNPEFRKDLEELKTRRFDVAVSALFDAAPTAVRELVELAYSGRDRVNACRCILEFAFKAKKMKNANKASEPEQETLEESGMRPLRAVNNQAVKDAIYLIP
jgi:hypothetical protein